MSICRKREKKYVSIRAHILILVLLTTEVHSGEGSDNYPGYFKQKKKGTEDKENPEHKKRQLGNVSDTRPRAKRAGQAILFSPWVYLFSITGEFTFRKECISIVVMMLNLMLIWLIGDMFT